MTSDDAAPPARVALAGFGNVGQDLASRLLAGAIPGLRLTAVSARDLDQARANAQALTPVPPVAPTPLVLPVAELPAQTDIIVECATADALPAIARAAMRAGKTLVPISMGGFVADPDLLDEIRHSGARVQIATGALPGLDALRAAAEGTIRSVTLTTSLRPESLAHEAYVRARGFDFTQPPERAVLVFEGSAREAALAFPRHFNVAVALSLAGIGLDRTAIRLFADPDIPGTRHELRVDADIIQLELISSNRPSPANPRTSLAVAASIMAALRSLVEPLRVGS
jgi:aspartate dehydrogenase